MTKPSKDLWVFVEHREQKPVDVSLELLSKGRKLADQLAGDLKAVVIGHEMDHVVKETFRFGADEVLLIEDPSLRDYRTQPYSRLVGDLIVERQPRVVLFGATSVGRDLAPRVASFTRSGLTADCTDLQIGDITYARKNFDGLLLQIRPAFGGNIVATIVTPDVAVQMATVREGVMEMVPISEPVVRRVTRLPYVATDSDEFVMIVERYQEESKANLKDAQIIVAGGYGMGTKENFGRLRQLASLMGGEVAGTRAAVDAGFITVDRQVGQTGLTVRPKLYIACGISGSIQHVAGMQHSNRIIAINKDANAPIFDVCHYGIVGDVTTTIPTFIDAFKEKLK